MFPTLCFCHPSSPITSLSPPGIAAGLPASRSTAHSKRAKEGTSQLRASRDTNLPSLISQKKNSCSIFPPTPICKFFIPRLGKACSRMAEATQAHRASLVPTQHLGPFAHPDSVSTGEKNMEKGHPKPLDCCTPPQ